MALIFKWEMGADCVLPAQESMAALKFQENGRGYPKRMKKPHAHKANPTAIDHEKAQRIHSLFFQGAPNFMKDYVLHGEHSKKGERQ